MDGGSEATAGGGDVRSGQLDIASGAEVWRIRVFYSVGGASSQDHPGHGSATVKATTFAPVQIVPEQLQLPPPAPDPTLSMRTSPSASEVIEIELANGHRLRVDRDVDADALRRVLSVLVAA